MAKQKKQSQNKASRGGTSHGGGAPPGGAAETIIEGVAEHVDESPDERGRATTGTSGAAWQKEKAAPKRPASIGFILGGLGVLISLGLGGFAVLETIRRPDTEELITPLIDRLNQIETRLAEAAEGEGRAAQKADLENLANRLNSDIAALAEAVDNLTASMLAAPAASDASPAPHASSAPHASPALTAAAPASTAAIDQTPAPANPLVDSSADSPVDSPVNPRKNPPAETPITTTPPTETGWGAWFGTLFSITRIDDAADKTDDAANHGAE